MERITELTPSQVENLRGWLQRPNGGWVLTNDELAFEAVEGGGLLVRSRKAMGHGPAPEAHDYHDEVTGYPESTEDESTLGIIADAMGTIAEGMVQLSRATDRMIEDIELGDTDLDRGREALAKAVVAAEGGDTAKAQVLREIGDTYLRGWESLVYRPQQLITNVNTEESR